MTQVHGISDIIKLANKTDLKSENLAFMRPLPSTWRGIGRST